MNAVVIGSQTFEAVAIPSLTGATIGASSLVSSTLFVFFLYFLAEKSLSLHNFKYDIQHNIDS